MPKSLAHRPDLLTEVVKVVLLHKRHATVKESLVQLCTDYIAATSVQAIHTSLIVQC